LNTSGTPFTEIYVQWLESFRALIPGARRAGASANLKTRQEEVAANQEWEQEGGAIQPAEIKPVLASVPKIPF
jgi:hypothetical protein